MQKQNKMIQFLKYNLESEPVQSIILSRTNENIIVFRYSLKKATIKVHYYEIDNWELVTIPENAKGILDLENEDVIYYYQKVNGKLTINYIDDNGNTLLPSEELIKQTGTDYQTEAKTIENYELSKVIGNEKGIYTKEDSVVTYVYEYVMGQGDMKDPIEEKPYTGITETNNTLDYILASSSLLSAAILVILKKNLTNFFFFMPIFFQTFTLTFINVIIKLGDNKWQKQEKQKKKLFKCY